jgi:hypothetical protein
MAQHLLDTVCPKLLAGTGVRATKVVIWETDYACAEAALDAAESVQNTDFERASAE